mmetsp:Transcript_5955/g.8361  ORF Transcript_5955/g.8361 Transcript_5955/m.8361 type:complete len:627 (-) Transcript_5955:35-1915(-)
MTMFESSHQAATHKQRWEEKVKMKKRAPANGYRHLISISGEELNTVFNKTTEKVHIPTPSISENSPLVHPMSARSHTTNSDSALNDIDDFSQSNVQKQTKKKLGLAALTVLIFYEVCGGPFGLEDIVRAGGPFYALLGFLLILIWSVPEALITAELSTAMPEASGSVAWVDCAFGPFWAFQKGWLSWLSGVADNALYPIIFLDCLLKLTNSNPNNEDGSFSYLNILNESSNGGNDTMRWLFTLAVTVVLTYLNYRGLDIVGAMAIGICLLSMLPFAVFCVLGAFKVQPARWLQTPVGGIAAVDWRLLLNTFFWNINFWDSAASFAGEVENPGRNYPLGMGIAMGLVFLSLFLPVLIGTGASAAPYSEWTDGYFVHLAGEIVGPWLSYWLMFAATITNVGMFEAEMSSDSWQIAGMADRGMLPAVLGRRSRFETPTEGILLSAVGIVCLCWMTFDQVIDMLNLLYCYGQAIEFLAFLQLRRARPDIARPYRIGVGFYGMCFMLFCPLVFIVLILSISSTISLVLSSVMVLLGPAVYFTLEVAKARKWCKFEDRFISYPSFASLADTSGSSKQSSFKQDTRESLVGKRYHQDVTNMVELELGGEVPHISNKRCISRDSDNTEVLAFSS